jgi:hypothetical protein
MKLSMRRSVHRDVVNEVQDQLTKGVTDIKVDTTVGTLHDRSVGWVVNAIHDLDRPDLILKVCGQVFFVLTAKRPYIL